MAYMIWIKRVGLILLIICMGTAIDYAVHQTDARFSVPFVYFPHKIFYGVLWSFLGYLVFRKKIQTHFSLAMVISASPAIILQAMYFIQHHLLVWVTVFFLLLHFLMFLLPAYFICKKYMGLFVSPLPAPKV